MKGILKAFFMLIQMEVRSLDVQWKVECEEKNVESAFYLERESR